MKKPIIFLLILLLSISVIACENKNASDESVSEYKKISTDEAKKMMESDVIILDVRTLGEYDSGHIKGAINVSVENIMNDDFGALTDKEKTILVYCRSGNRSRSASMKLLESGYKNIYDFGGIIDWNGELEQ